MPCPPAHVPTDHHRSAADRRARVDVLTISDTRTPDTDEAGQLIRTLLTAAGHEIFDHTIVPDEPQQIEQQLHAWLYPDPRSPDPGPQLIISTGGTGIAPRDTTIEIIERLIQPPHGKPLPGFGELFRMLSYQAIGPAAMLSRAVAGLSSSQGNQDSGVFLFALPGSPNAVRLALEKLILPELPHLLWERSR